MLYYFPILSSALEDDSDLDLDDLVTHRLVSGWVWFCVITCAIISVHLSVIFCRLRVSELVAACASIDRKQSLSNSITISAMVWVLAESSLSRSAVIQSGLFSVQLTFYALNSFWLLILATLWPPIG